MTGDSKAFCATGEALFGPTWQTAMADRLAVTTRTVNRWATGSHPISAEWWDDIDALCERRLHEIADTRDAIRQHIKQAKR